MSEIDMKEECLDYGKFPYCKPDCEVLCLRISKPYEPLVQTSNNSQKSTVKEQPE